jgi:hypothetical protein
MSGDPGINLVLANGRELHSSISGSAIAASIVDNPSGCFGSEGSQSLNDIDRLRGRIAEIDQTSASRVTVVAATAELRP